ncbi:MAG: insulinase family protein, partial [Clostridia bacterium]|nr:insulinase family protein [Clostridia bacterium]
GSFNLYAGTNPKNGETVIREIQEQMAIFLRDGLTEKEFRSAKAQLRGGFLLGLESSSGRMQSLGRGMLLFGKTRTPEETIARIDAVTMDSVMEIAGRVLRSEPSAAIVGRSADKFLSYIGGGLNG